MANIIPMAGLGKRFTEKGYQLPKPLIPISGKPMIIRVIESLPKSDKWIFIVRKEHIDNYKLDVLLKKEIPHAKVITVEKTTEGQAATCMLAMPYVDPDEPILIAACDNSFDYDKKKFEQLTKDPQIDAVIWTFTEHPSLMKNPRAWGWLKLEEDKITIKDVSIKKPISRDPFHDHAVVATFYFKKAKEFQEAYEQMVKENYRINNEFYVDAIPLFYKKKGKRSVIFDVNHYVGWGKPEDLELYHAWEKQCKQGEEHKLPKERKKEYTLWKRFFKRLR